MNPESQKLINEKLKQSSVNIDNALTMLCESASLAILDRSFIYTEILVQIAQGADNLRARCLCSILSEKSLEKNQEKH